MSSIPSSTSLARMLPHLPARGSAVLSAALVTASLCAVPGRADAGMTIHQANRFMTDTILPVAKRVLGVAQTAHIENKNGRLDEENPVREDFYSDLMVYPFLDPASPIPRKAYWNRIAPSLAPIPDGMAPFPTAEVTAEGSSVKVQLYASTANDALLELPDAALEFALVHELGHILHLLGKLPSINDGSNIVDRELVADVASTFLLCEAGIDVRPLYTDTTASPSQQQLAANAASYSKKARKRAVTAMVFDEEWSAGHAPAADRAALVKWAAEQWQANRTTTDRAQALRDEVSAALVQYASWKAKSTSFEASLHDKAAAWDKLSDGERQKAILDAQARLTE